MTTMEHTPSPEQSLKIINEMMSQAKKSFQKVHFYFLLWGVLFSLAGIAAFLIARAGSHYSWAVYPAAGVIGGILSGIYSGRQEDKRHVVTMMDRVHQWLWVGYLITLLIMIVGLVSFRLDPNPYVLILTGFPTFVSGALMRFRPLMVGGSLFWIIGLISVFFLREYSPLIYSLGIIVGYIIPGIMLKRQEDGVRTT